MAWYSLYKWFIPWRKIPYRNMITMYKNYLYDTWFDSLSEEEQQNELKRITDIKDKRKRDGEQALYNLTKMYQIMDDSTHGKVTETMKIVASMNKFTISPSKYW